MTSSPSALPGGAPEEDGNTPVPLDIDDFVQRETAPELPVPGVRLIAGGEEGGGGSSAPTVKLEANGDAAARSSSEDTSDQWCVLACGAAGRRAHDAHALAHIC